MRHTPPSSILHSSPHRLGAVLRWWCRSVALLYLGTPALLGAQTAEAPRSVAVTRLQAIDVIRLDGVLDEAVWQRVSAATGFTQREPNVGDPATEPTEVRVVIDADRIILGVMLHDSQPDRVFGNQMQRDQSFDSDDRFIWTFDTFANGRTGYFFEVNPLGAMGDGLIDPASGDGEFGVGINRSWDGIWTARVRRLVNGWSAEVEIPFKTLNFDPEGRTWGVNFQRTLRRLNEESLWTGFARNQGLARMVNAGRLAGLDGLSQGVGLALRPYGVATLSSAPGRGLPAQDAAATAGLDAFYNLTPALRANLSVNTDFAETEVDRRRVNLTRFPLFFEEKRDFFLEGSSFFDFSREGGEAIVPFFSRRIGLDSSGRPQRVELGGKLTGQAGPWDIGVLQIRTADTTPTGVAVTSPAEDFSVVRIRRRLFEQSYVGGLYTRRALRERDASAAQTAGADFAFQTSRFRTNRNLALSGYFVNTTQPAGVGKGSAYGVRAAYPNEPVTLELAAQAIEPNYDPAVGFVERRAYLRLNPTAEWAPRLRNHPWIRGFEFSLDANLLNDFENRPLTRAVQLPDVEMNFQDGGRVSFEVNHQFERLEEDFEISDGVILPAGGRYEFTNYQLSAASSDRRVVAVDSDFTFGGFFSGSRRELTIEFSARPRRGVSMALEVEQNTLRLAEGSFSAAVYRAQINTQASPWVSIANTLQYDTVSRQMGWQLRFRWIERPGTDLFVVYTHNWQETGPPLPRRLSTLDQRLATKLVYTIRL
jgi:hypothetical protein